MASGWSDGIVRMAGIDPTILAGRLDFAGLALGQLCSGLHRHTVESRRAYAGNLGTATMAHDASSLPSDRLALG